MKLPLKKQEIVSESLIHLASLKKKRKRRVTKSDNHRIAPFSSNCTFLDMVKEETVSLEALAALNVKIGMGVGSGPPHPVRVARHETGPEIDAHLRGGEGES